MIVRAVIPYSHIGGFKLPWGTFCLYLKVDRINFCHSRADHNLKFRNFSMEEFSSIADLRILSNM
jgi:hypothetical protein